MIGIIVVWIVNCFRALRNLWRRVLRRHVDYVQIEVGGALPEFVEVPGWVQRRFLGMRAPASMHALRRQFERIALDPRTAGVLLKINGLATGWATRRR